MVNLGATRPRSELSSPDFQSVQPLEAGASTLPEIAELGRAFNRKFKPRPVRLSHSYTRRKRTDAKGHPGTKDSVLLRTRMAASQQNVSVLAEVGILGRRKQGNHIYYRIVDEGVFALCEEVCGSVRQQLQALNELVAGAASE